MVRLAAFDMDGTLLMPDHQVGAETLDALHRLLEQNVALTFATGRHFLEVRTIARRLGLHGYMITGNGTRVHDCEGIISLLRIFRQKLRKKCCIRIGALTPRCMYLGMMAGLLRMNFLNC